MARGVVRGSRTTPTLGWSGPEWLAHYLAASEVWKSVLGRYVDPVATFSGMGGREDQIDGLLARLTDETSLPFTRREFDQEPTLVGTLGARAGGPVGDSIALRPQGTRPPLFLIAGSGGVALQFAWIAHELGAEYPVIALQSRAAQQYRLPEYSLRAQARRLADRVEQFAPDGEVVVGGHSMGGLVALRVARELVRRGRPVRHLVILDTRPEGRLTRGRTDVPPTRHPLRIPRPIVLNLGAALVAGAVPLRRGRRYQSQWLLGQIRRLFVAEIPPFSGRTHLLMTRHDPEHTERGWRVRGGDLEVIPVEGSHNSCLRPPHVAALSTHLRAILDNCSAK